MLPVLSTRFVAALAGLRARAAEISQRLDDFNDKLFGVFKISAKKIAGIQLFAVIGLGFTMIQVAEYAAADFCWVLATLALSIRVLASDIDELRPVRGFIGLLLRAIGVCALGVVAIVWTNAKRADSPWSAFVPMLNREKALWNYDPGKPELCPHLCPPSPPSINSLVLPAKAATKVLAPDIVKTETDDDAMNFHEVTPEEVGIPDNFLVEFGGINLEETRQQLTEGSSSYLPPVGGFPLRIYFDAKGHLLVDATVVNLYGVDVAKIEGNKFAVGEPGWDHNFDKNCLEIVDPEQNVYLRIERISKRVLVIEGFFVFSPKDALLIANGTSIRGNFGDHPRFPKPVFMYPSKDHLHERRKP